MSGIVRKTLRLGGMAGALALLSACGGDDKSGEETGTFPLASGSSAFDWPMEDPSFRENGDYVADGGYAGGSLPADWQPLPAARPMVASAGPRYDYAPSYDYYDDGPVYYDDAPNDSSYAWLALAAMMGDTFADSPPDYYFDYGDVEPWVWETEDHYIRYAEPLDDGYRYYYYEPYATRPFLIRDPDYAYGYRDDRLVVIYDDYGRVLDGRRAWHQRRAAANYYARARSLHQHWDDRPRYGVSAPLWDSRREIFAREQSRWDRAREGRSQWRNWDDRNERTIRSRWVGEQAARQYAGQRFADWRRDDFRGEAPRFAQEARREARVQQAAQRQLAVMRQDASRDMRDGARPGQFAARGFEGQGGRSGNVPREALLAGRRDEQRRQAFFERAAGRGEDRASALASQPRGADRRIDRFAGMRDMRQAELRQKMAERGNAMQRRTDQPSAQLANRAEAQRGDRAAQDRGAMRERLVAQRQFSARGPDTGRQLAQQRQAEARKSDVAQRRAEARQQRFGQGGEPSRLAEQRQVGQRQAETRQRMVEQRQAQMQQRASRQQAEGRQRMMEQRQAQTQQRRQDMQRQAAQSQSEGRQRMMEQRREQMQQNAARQQSEGRQRMMEQRQQQMQQRQSESRQQQMQQRQAQMQQRQGEMQQRQSEGRQQQMQQRQAEMQQRQSGMQQRMEARRAEGGNRGRDRSASFR